MSFSLCFMDFETEALNCMVEMMKGITERREKSFNIASKFYGEADFEKELILKKSSSFKRADCSNELT